MLPDGYEGTKYEIGPIEPSPENPGDEEDEKKPATSISINKNITTMTVGDTATITYEVVPADTTDEITFTSSAPDVASVNANGVITALSEGIANITVKTDSNQSDMITVTVKPEQSNPEPGDGEEEITTASKISIDKATTSLYVGETMTVKVGVLPADAVTKLSFSSGDPSIAVIDENGVLLARKAGQVNISVVDENSG